MKLAFNCVKCGKHIGMYVGEPFQLAGAVKSDAQLEVRCAECAIPS